MGFCILLMGGHTHWAIPFALAIIVLISSYLVRVKTMWRQAPFTAAVVVAAGISVHSTLASSQWITQSRRGTLWLASRSGH